MGNSTQTAEVSGVSVPWLAFPAGIFSGSDYCSVLSCSEFVITYGTLSEDSIQSQDCSHTIPKGKQPCLPWLRRSELTGSTLQAPHQLHASPQSAQNGPGCWGPNLIPNCWKATPKDRFSWCQVKSPDKNPVSVAKDSQTGVIWMVLTCWAFTFFPDVYIQQSRYYGIYIRYG